MLTPRPALLQHRGARERGNAAGARSPPLPGLLEQQGCAVVPSPRTGPLSHSQPAKDMAKTRRCFQTGTRVELLLQQRALRRVALAVMDQPVNDTVKSTISTSHALPAEGSRGSSAGAFCSPSCTAALQCYSSASSLQHPFVEPLPMTAMPLPVQKHFVSSG